MPAASQSSVGVWEFTTCCGCARINTVADAVICDWCSHRGGGKPGTEDLGAEPCCKCGRSSAMFRKQACAFE